MKHPSAFWHALPLHYAPHLLHTGALYAQAQFAVRSLPLSPRPTATRRDRKLGLDKCVHFSFAPHTPLLSDKQKKGYPHALLQWDSAIADLTGAALMPFNAKAWAHRDAFAPITNADEKAAFLREREQTGRFPSAELLVLDVVPLAPLCVGLHVENQETAAWLAAIVETIQPSCAPPIIVSPESFPSVTAAAFDWEPLRAYLQTCASWGIVARAIGGSAPPFPAPPLLPFD